MVTVVMKQIVALLCLVAFASAACDAGDATCEDPIAFVGGGPSEVAEVMHRC